MLKKIQNALIFRLNKSATLKNKLLQLMDLFYQYAPVFVGYFRRNPAYIKHVINSKVIAKPGLFSYGAVFNPGALLANGEILLLANAQKVPWFKAKGKNKDLYMQGNPLLMRLNQKSEEIIDQNIITKIIDLTQDQDYAIEDFRLFQWKDQKMINHSLVIRNKIDGFINQSGSFSALSILDEIEKTFTFCAIPQVDFPLQDFEKNWVYKETENQLLLFYSVSPYKVLTLDHEKSFSFKTIIDQHLSSKMNDPGGFGTRVSFSTNPIDYDENHWLTVIHQIQHRFTGRCYFHWAVLIDKTSFLPMKISSKSIFSGMGARGRVPGIRYISSIVKAENEILFFAGEGDVYVSVTKKKITELQTLFVNL